MLSHGIESDAARPPRPRGSPTASVLLATRYPFLQRGYAGVGEVFRRVIVRDNFANAARKGIGCCGCVWIFDPGAWQLRTTVIALFRELCPVYTWSLPGGFTTRLPGIYGPRDRESCPSLLRKHCTAPRLTADNAHWGRACRGYTGLDASPVFFVVLHWSPDLESRPIRHCVFSARPNHLFPTSLGLEIPYQEWTIKSRRIQHKRLHLRRGRFVSILSTFSSHLGAKVELVLQVSSPISRCGTRREY